MSDINATFQKMKDEYNTSNDARTRFYGEASDLFRYIDEELGKSVVANDAKLQKLFGEYDMAESDDSLYQMLTIVNKIVTHIDNVYPET